MQQPYSFFVVLEFLVHCFALLLSWSCFSVTFIICLIVDTHAAHCRMANEINKFRPITIPTIPGTTCKMNIILSV